MSNIKSKNSRNFKELPKALAEVAILVDKVGMHYIYLQYCVDCEVELRRVKSILSLIPKCRSCSKRTHGLCYTKGYTMWQGMKGRCYNNKHGKYHRYGARGIVVCDSWLDPEVFNTWYLEAKGDLPDTITSIHRVDNDAEYSPDNCIIITIAEHNKLHGILRQKNK